MLTCITLRYKTFRIITQLGTLPFHVIHTNFGSPSRSDSLFLPSLPSLSSFLDYRNSSSSPLSPNPKPSLHSALQGWERSLDPNTPLIHHASGKPDTTEGSDQQWNTWVRKPPNASWEITNRSMHCLCHLKP